MSERIVVTGVGVVAPNGLGAGDFWAATLAADSGIRRLTRFDPSSYPTQVGGEVLGFAPAQHVPGRLVPQTDRVTQFALAATDWALEDAGIAVTDLNEYEIGVITANGCGGFEFGQHELQKLWSEGPHRVSAYQSFAWFYAVNTGQLSIRHGAKGHSSVMVAEQAGGLDALACARRHLRKGSVRIAITGGMDAPLCPWGLTAQIPNGRLSTSHDPRRAFLPFDRDANGYVPGEGGAILLLEEREAALARGAPRIYGEIAGYTASFDPAQGTGRPPALARAIRGALDDAGVEPAEVDVVIADASGLPALDEVEAEAIRQVFGPRAVAVSIPKTMTGRLYSGGGPLDVVSALMMIKEGVVPAAANVSDVPDQYEIDVVREQARQLPIRTVLIVARGHGGFNSALVVKAV
ncbi:ketosynthase chain-length factor [Nonomuraea sp. NPDC003804]|uniref:ketosynthase chain-length factor n=1 Tax=Nonomuraea sp. NPDC003804 TaxID=3154547 RepID=UPI0033A9F24F